MIDLKKIISETTRYNFHSHTQFCDGRSTMDAFATQAIALGLEHYGFSPHSPIPIESPCNMKHDDVPLYLDEVARLKQLHHGKINLYASMEIDFIDGWGPAHPYYQALPLDYRIGSVHFIPSFDNPEEYVDIDGRYENFKLKMEKYFHEDIESVVRSYYAQSLKLVEAGGFDIIAHCDKIGHNASCHCPGIEDEPWYQQLIKRHIDAIMDHHYIVEVNTKAWQQFNRFFPGERYFSLLKKYNAPVMFNSDCHYTELIEAGRDEAIKRYNEAM